jgi:pSer/pThr/pTyr-binding forkhead associated (FHA) protein
MNLERKRFGSKNGPYGNHENIAPLLSSKVYPREKYIFAFGLSAKLMPNALKLTAPDSRKPVHFRISWFVAWPR